MRRSLLLLLCAVIGTALVACNKETPPPAEPTAAAPAAAPAPAAPAPAAAAAAEPAKPAGHAESAAGTAAAAAAGDPEKDCGALYDFVEGMKKALTKQLGPGKANKPLPPRDKFVVACKELPAPVVHCMNPQNAMAKPQQCQAEMQKFQQTHAAALARFKSLMK